VKSAVMKKSEGDDETKIVRVPAKTKEQTHHQRRNAVNDREGKTKKDERQMRLDGDEATEIEMIGRNGEKREIASDQETRSQKVALIFLDSIQKVEVVTADGMLL
jgi:hypothetical protein